jgi:hypothetical protein
VVCSWQLDVAYLPNGGFSKPWELREGNKQFLTTQQQPEAARRDIDTSIGEDFIGMCLN